MEKFSMKSLKGKAMNLNSSVVTGELKKCQTSFSFLMGQKGLYRLIQVGLTLVLHISLHTKEQQRANLHSWLP